MSFFMPINNTFLAAMRVSVVISPCSVYICQTGVFFFVCLFLTQNVDDFFFFFSFRFCHSGFENTLLIPTALVTILCTWLEFGRNIKDTKCAKMVFLYFSFMCLYFQHHFCSFQCHMIHQKSQYLALKNI